MHAPKSGETIGVSQQYGAKNSHEEYGRTVAPVAKYMDEKVGHDDLVTVKREPDAQAHRSYAPRAGRVPELAVEEVLHVLSGRLEHHLGFLRFFLYVLVLMVTTGGAGAPSSRPSALDTRERCAVSVLALVRGRAGGILSRGHSLSLLD